MPWWRRNQRERDLERELRSHLELESAGLQQDGLSPAETDLPTLAAATLILAAAGLLAEFLPAWRASSIDPMAALRYE